MTHYIIRAALQEEANNGWVWVCGPSLKNLQSRTVVKISRPGHHCCGVYTEVRKVDCNFLQEYNASPRIFIDCKQDTIVMAEWYRVALGIRYTTNRDNIRCTVPLCVKEIRCWGYNSLRFACHHPDPVVRLGTRLGILGAWLGLLALLDPLLKVYEHLDEHYDCFRSLKAFLRLSGTTEYLHACAMIIIALPLAALGVWACWGRPQPRLK